MKVSTAACFCNLFECTCELIIHTKCLGCRKPTSPLDLVYCRCEYAQCQRCFDQLKPVPRQQNGGVPDCPGCTAPWEWHGVISYLQNRLRCAHAARAEDASGEGEVSGDDEEEQEVTPASVSARVLPPVPPFSVVRPPVKPFVLPQLTPTGDEEHPVPPFVFQCPYTQGQKRAADDLVSPISLDLKKQRRMILLDE